MPDTFVEKDVKLVDLQAPKVIPERLFSIVKSPIERAFRLDILNEVYRGVRRRVRHKHFFDATLDELRVQYAVSEADLARIPREGPLLVVANHPFGGLEGIILGSLLNSVRNDVKVLGNHLLHIIPEIRPNLISLNPFGGKGASRANFGALREAIKLLQSGGALITFPAGEVSSLRLDRRRVTDPEWTPHIASLVRHSGANVLPVFFEGRNSSFFQVMGMVHPRLRTALLAHELFRRRGNTVPVQIGHPISHRKLLKLGSHQEVTRYLRVNTYFLKNRRPSEKKGIFLKFPGKKSPPPQEIIPPVPKPGLLGELASLPPEQLLLSEKEFDVFYAKASQIPRLMLEIGRLRETAFRSVNEGTGKAYDLDVFDQTYLQLFLWNRQDQQLVGAYRLGQMDLLLQSTGEKGLYTNTLFKFKPGFLEQLGPALELGRSFIRPEYQRKYGCLTLLWKGIGRFIISNPHYHVLFGPVSISRDYHTVSKNLIVQFLREHNRYRDLAKLVKPRNPHRGKRINGVGKQDLRKTLHSIDDVSALIAEIEHDGKKIPILLRHYLKLNAQLLSFNVDKEFSDVLDGLVVIDLKRTDPRMILRFMGKKEGGRYLERHGIKMRRGKPQKAQKTQKDGEWWRDGVIVEEGNHGFHE